MRKWILIVVLAVVSFVLLAMIKAEKWNSAEIDGCTLYYNEYYDWYNYGVFVYYYGYCDGRFISYYEYYGYY